jgi:alkylation response protein AidB-like acyl-CoA dehydrogenase
MRIAFTAEQEELRRELRGYLAGLMTAQVRAALADGDGDYGDGQAYREVVRRLGHNGWLALGWPAKYGGRAGPILRPTGTRVFPSSSCRLPCRASRLRRCARSRA